MRVRRLLIPLLPILAAIVIACGGDEEPGETPTSAAAATATPTMAAPEASPTAELAATKTPAPTLTATAEPEDGIGPDAIWAPTLSLDRLQQSCDKIGPECLEPLSELERQDGAPEEAIEFFLAHEAFLVSFEEHGAVDFGAVSSPFFNMGRPEPVFLNGDFSFMYVGEVVPQDWQEEPSYGEVGDALAWVEYSSLVDVTSEGSTQVFAIEVPIRDCRACEPLGALSLELIFDDGAFERVQVLPLADVATPTP